MIVASIFQELFSGLTLTYNEFKSDLVTTKEVTKDIQFHWGDNKELAKWLRGRSGKEKFPLIWYVIDTVDNSNIDTIKANCVLVLFTSTKQEYYNNTRALINYTNIIDPLTDLVYSIVSQQSAISLVYNSWESIFKTYDLPNYGVDSDELDWKRKELKGEKGITIDIVDARKIEFQARFDKKCLI
jgi:hypothetical protein